MSQLDCQPPRLVFRVLECAFSRSAITTAQIFVDRWGVRHVEDDKRCGEQRHGFDRRVLRLRSTPAPEALWGQFHSPWFDANAHRSKTSSVDVAVAYK